jgi:hypothetical protein
MSEKQYSFQGDKICLLDNFMKIKEVGTLIIDQRGVDLLLNILA